MKCCLTDIIVFVFIDMCMTTIKRRLYILFNVRLLVSYKSQEIFVFNTTALIIINSTDRSMFFLSSTSVYLLVLTWMKQNYLLLLLYNNNLIIPKLLLLAVNKTIRFLHQCIMITHKD